MTMVDLQFAVVALAIFTAANVIVLVSVMSYVTKLYNCVRDLHAYTMDLACHVNFTDDSGDDPDGGEPIVEGETVVLFDRKAA